MSWFNKEKPFVEPSKYRIVPKGESSWGIQVWHNYLKDYEDVVVIKTTFGSTYTTLKGYYSFAPRYGEKLFLTGTMEECKGYIDEFVNVDNKSAAIKTREADTSLYLDYP